MPTSKAGINSQSLNRLDVLEAALPSLATKLIPQTEITAAHVIVEANLNTELISNVAGAHNITIGDALAAVASAGDKVSVIWYGAGTTSIVVTGSQTINGATAAIPMATQYQGVVITKAPAANAWVVSGAI